MTTTRRRDLQAQERVRTAAVLPPEPWKSLAVGAMAPIGLAAAAAYTSSVTDSEKVAQTAWIAAAIIGTAAIIATSAATRRIYDLDN